MFERMTSWLGKLAPSSVVNARLSVDSSTSSETSPAAEATSIPPQARKLARRLLELLLKHFGAEEQIADIEEMDIASHRALLQLLPLRIYVYALASTAAKVDFMSILSSQRPKGAVFDAFEIDIEGVHCGFYLYSLSALSDAEMLHELWCALRTEIGRPVFTAALPPEHSQHHLQADVITIEGTPDELAERLIAPHLPTKFLDEISIADDQGFSRFLVQLFHRIGKSSIEKDELIRFVEKNRPYCDEKFVQFLEIATDAAIRTDKSTGTYFRYVTDNIRLALARDFDSMDMRSDRLFWLVYALSLLIDSDKIASDAARSRLASPDTVQRISQHQLFYMIDDYRNALDSPQQPSVTMLMLIGECALLGKSGASLRIVCKLLLHNPDRRRRAEIIDLVGRAIEWLQAQSEATDELPDQLDELRNLTRQIPDDDF